MTGLILDTHTCIWYLVRDVRLSQSALQAIRDAVASEDRCYVPSICLVETAYLMEKGRIPESSYGRLLEALDTPNSNLVVWPLDSSVARAVRQIPRDSVPDLPDRVIAATALALGLPLITRDARIRALPSPTIW